jgi:IMP dehydrogenase/GMP reductase
MKFKLTQIKSIEAKQYKGKVFDLTVEDDHSYNINGTLVHNSLCSTRKNTGHGVPMISSLMETSSIGDQYGVPIIADGGLRNSGDIAKAIAAGAESVILGSMISATEETPGAIFRGHNGKMYKNYRGSASIESKLDRGEKRNIEGVATVKHYKGSVEFVINEIKDNLKSALSYSGVENIYDFIVNSEFIKITNAGMVEANTHGVK